MIVFLLFTIIFHLRIATPLSRSIAITKVPYNLSLAITINRDIEKNNNEPGIMKTLGIRIL